MKYSVGDGRCVGGMKPVVDAVCRPRRLAFKMAAEDLRLFFDCRCGVVAQYVSPTLVAGPVLATGG